ncbi:unnamed protein product [Meganyctiphanes norvegica]|uniref:Integrase catalytic domain-containing protein n=1 Tax=Meganyctiphanes norvegica TaxID=48144 RepID=A0AAV2PJ54_MEGNR
MTCVQLQRPPPRPVVCIPMASEFNEAVSMDLKIYGKYYFLVIVDMATRFCAATVVQNKCPSTIITGLFTSWITIFGAPKKILTDNGREFNNSEMRALGEAFNIKIMTTAAESPWSNGICERLNGVLGTLVNKIIFDVKCDIRMALAWAVSARNAYDNNSGFSPNQLVFGFNPAIPDIFHNKLPGFEEVTSSEIVRRNLNALHVARHEFVKVESNERIRRALRHNVRNTEVKDLHNGDAVFYKRNNEQRWRGPGIVIGRDGKQVLVKHSGTFVRVHTVRLAKMPKRGKTRELGSFDSSSGLSKNVEPGSVDGSRELGSFDSSSGSGRNVEPGSFDGSRELGSFDGSNGFGKNGEPGSFDGSRELGSFDGSNSLGKNVEPGSFDGSRELRSFDGSSSFGKNGEPGSFDGSRELGSFDGSSSLGKNVEPGSFDGSRELRSFDGSSGFGKNGEPGSFDGSKELGSFDGSSSFEKNVEPGSFDGSRELRSFDGSSGFARNVEPGSFDGSRELRSFDGSSRSGRNADLFDHRPLDADRSGTPKFSNFGEFGEPGSSDPNGSSIPRSVSVENRFRGAVGSKVSKLDLGTKEGNGPSGKYVKQQDDTTCAVKMGHWKKGQRFQGLDPVTGMLISGKILGRAGKVTGVNKDCYNVQMDNDGWTGWFNLATLRELSEVNENIEMIILFSNDAVTVAKNKEIQTWIETIKYLK